MAKDKDDCKPLHAIPAAEPAQIYLTITRSQQMALTSILVAYMRTEEPQLFIDALSDVETTTPDLLNLIMQGPR